MKNKPAEAVIQIEFRVELQYILEQDALEEAMEKLREFGTAVVKDAVVENFAAPPALKAILTKIKET